MVSSPSASMWSPEELGFYQLHLGEKQLPVDKEGCRGAERGERGEEYFSKSKMNIFFENYL